MRIRSKFSLFFFLFCFSFSFLLHAQKPKWVKQRPADPEYYSGLYRVVKTGSKSDYIQEARSKALQELAGEISVTVSGNSVLHQLEDEYGFVQKYESQVSSSVLQTLEGYEIQTWENKKYYWVYVRLSKSKYAFQKKIKLDKAKMSASVFIEEAQRQMASKRPYAALESYVRALLTLKEHLQDDLLYRSTDGSEDLGLAMHQGIESILNGFELAPLQRVYSVDRTQVSRLKPGVTAFFRIGGDRYVSSSVPVVFEMSSGKSVFVRNGTTDRQGVVTTTFQQMSQGLKRQVLYAKLDLDPVKQLMGSESALFDVFFGRFKLPATELVIELAKNLAQFEMKEKLFDDFAQCETLQQDIRAVLSQNFFDFENNPGKAKYKVYVDAEIKKGERKQGVGYEVFLVTGRLSFTVKELRTDTEILVHSISGVKGMQPGGYEKAVEWVCNAIFLKFQEEILPVLEQLDL